MSKLKAKLLEAVGQYKKDVKNTKQELIGSKIISIRPMTPDEALGAYGDSKDPSSHVIELDSGWQIYAVSKSATPKPGRLEFYKPYNSVVVQGYNIAENPSEELEA